MAVLKDVVLRDAVLNFIAACHVLHRSGQNHPACHGTTVVSKLICKESDNVYFKLGKAELLSLLYCHCDAKAATISM